MDSNKKTDNVENLILEHLRAIRTGQDRIENEVKEVKHRLTGVEQAITANRRDGVATQEDVYRQQSTIDGLNDRLSRIEKRLEMAD
jgi:predicted  nucleic acid-binding Zn-ribbon protein